MISLSCAPIFGVALLFVTPAQNNLIGRMARNLLLAEVALTMVGIVGCIEIGGRHHPSPGWTIWPIWGSGLATLGSIHFVRYARSETRSKMSTIGTEHSLTPVPASGKA
jgi:hypothetical protein